MAADLPGNYGAKCRALLDTCQMYWRSRRNRNRNKQVTVTDDLGFIFALVILDVILCHTAPTLWSSKDAIQLWKIGAVVILTFLLLWHCMLQWWKSIVLPTMAKLVPDHPLTSVTMLENDSYSFVLLHFCKIISTAPMQWFKGLLYQHFSH